MHFLLRQRFAKTALPRLVGRLYSASGHDHGAHGDKKTSFKDEDVVGPGTTDPDLIASPYEQAAGLERLELLGKVAGRSAFLMEPLKVDHYGTLTDPILVDSVEGRRIVGCTGFPKQSHDPLYFWVDHNEGPMRCQDCGQAFRINKLH